ncbi:MAG: type II toxin-antitoxin system RelE/ParE family toxin [Candidatus Paceibacterota bacterium]
MTKIIQKESAKKSLDELPNRIQKKYLVQKNRLEKNRRDTRLHTKKLKNLSGVYSFRITRAYRGLFYFHTEEIIVIFAIGHRKDIYSK